MDLTNSSYLIPFECNETYDSTLEILKYIATISYLVPGFLLHILILRCILVKEWRFFKESSFFQVYAADSVASLTIILLDIFFARLFLFIPPFCPIIGPFFWEPSIFLKTYYYLNNHARFAKSVAQIFMVLNRMSCVLWPMSYGQIWKKCLGYCILLIFLLPILGTWNILISRMKAFSSFGGFGIGYNKAVDWASLSLFQLIYVSIALIATVICTTVTLYKLIFLSDRIKSVEKSLCITSICISVTFLLVAATQVHYALFPQTIRVSWIYIAQFLAFDLLTVGSAVIMFGTNQQLRSLITPLRFHRIDENRVFQMSSTASNLEK